MPALSRRHVNGHMAKSQKDKEELKMKRTMGLAMVLLLTISLLTACGSGSSSNTPSGSSNTPATTPPDSDNGGNSNNTPPANQDKRVIKASELLSKGDAERLLGGNIEVKEKNDDKIDVLSLGKITTIYNSDAGASSPYYISIGLYQNATLDNKNAQHKVFIDKGGISDYQEGIRADRENRELAVKIDDLGEWACITGFEKLDSFGTHTLEIGYGDYCISVTMVNWPKGNTFNDEEKIAWKTDKLTEAGRLAFERLEALIK